jgi:micrococcal nuclease
MAWVPWDKHLWRGLVTIGAVAIGVLPSGVAGAHVLPCVPGDSPELATVAAVLGGETVQLDGGRVVVLAGIEAPRPPLKLPQAAPWPPALAAKQALERLVAGRQVAIVPAGSQPDRHGRWRANVFFEGRWVQAGLVAAGWARVHWLPLDPACIFALLEQERGAREANLGLWRNASYRVLDASDASLERRNGLYELVQGRVRSVGHGRYMTFLDFGRDYWRDFTIMVSPDVADGLAGAGLPVDGLKGRRVRVRGVIEESGGPAVRLNDPAEIEVLDDGDD